MVTTLETCKPIKMLKLNVELIMQDTIGSGTGLFLFIDQLITKLHLVLVVTNLFFLSCPGRGANLGSFGFCLFYLSKAAP